MVLKRILLATSLVLLFACNQTDKPVKPVENDETQENVSSPTEWPGKKIYDANCKVCHGSDGTLGLNNAKNLQASTLSVEEETNQVKNGKGLMPPFKETLKEEEIDQVVQYVQTLRK